MHPDGMSSPRGRSVVQVCPAAGTSCFPPCRWHAPAAQALVQAPRCADQIADCMLTAVTC